MYKDIIRLSTKLGLTNITNYKIPVDLLFVAVGFSTQKYLDSHMTNKHPEKSEINSFIEEKNGVHRELHTLITSTFF